MNHPHAHACAPHGELHPPQPTPPPAPPPTYPPHLMYPTAVALWWSGSRSATATIVMEKEDTMPPSELSTKYLGGRGEGEEVGCAGDADEEGWE